MPQIENFLRKTRGSGLPLPPVVWVLSPWAQGVAGSNPVAPTKSLQNPRKPHDGQRFSARALPARFRQESPSHARFRRKVVTNLVTPKPHLSDATEGASWKAAVRNGHARLLTAPVHNSNRLAERALPARGSCRRTAPPVFTTPPRKRARRGPRLGANSTCHESGACAAGGAVPSGATRELCARVFFEGNVYGLRSSLE